ncbi:hypothetical protein VNO77_21065 [Canavalia gladiata]|uniref:Uncharacterized protein n=1 Tax=Canavalia gladiata TaxID=3824 RepID=A0AAN9LUH9_CANGL
MIDSARNWNQVLVLIWLWERGSNGFMKEVKELVYIKFGDGFVKEVKTLATYLFGRDRYGKNPKTQIRDPSGSK